MIEIHGQTDGARLHRPSPREQRFESLFDRYAREVFAYARRRATAPDADDVVAETFVIVWRRLDDVPENPRAWLLGVARRCLANRHRGERRRVALVDRLANVPAPSGMVEAGSSLTLSDPVQVALRALSADGREVLALLAWEGLTPDEAAQVLGCTRAALYLRLSRARRRFAKELQVQRTSKGRRDEDS